MRGTWSLVVLLGCGGAENERTASADATASASSDTTTATTTTGMESTAASATTGGDGDSAGSTDTATGETGGVEPGPSVIFDGPPGDALIPGWDPTNPRPIIAAQLGFGDAWAGASLIIHADGTVTNNAQRIVVWGFEPLTMLYDGPHFGGSLPGWDSVAPAPVVALGTGPTHGDDWLTMSPGLWVDTNAGFVAPGSTLDRIVAWSFDAATDPPSQIYRGPWDGSLAFPMWDHEAPSPVIAWADNVVVGQWQQAPVAVFSDGSTEGFPSGGLLVYGW